MDHGKRVLYLDIDAHHGDGVQWAFYSMPSVLAVSFHQDGRCLFPGSGSLNEIGQGKGTGYTVNVPMLPGTDDKVFFMGFQHLVPRLMEAFRPHVIVSQLGVDTFREDPLANLELTTNGFCKVIDYLTKHAPAWVALGGGGYDMSNVARAWTLAWAMMNHVELPEELPEVITTSHGSRFASRQRLRDNEYTSPHHQQCQEHMEVCLTYLDEKVLRLLV